MLDRLNSQRVARPPSRLSLFARPRSLSASPPSVDAILIPNSKKITSPSELFNGVLGEIASVACQLA